MAELAFHRTVGVHGWFGRGDRGLIGVCLIAVRDDRVGDRGGRVDGRDDRVTSGRCRVADRGGRDVRVSAEEGLVVAEQTIRRTGGVHGWLPSLSEQFRSRSGDSRGLSGRCRGWLIAVEENQIAIGVVPRFAGCCSSWKFVEHLMCRI